MLHPRPAKRMGAAEALRGAYLHGCDAGGQADECRVLSAATPFVVELHAPPGLLLCRGPGRVRAEAAALLVIP